MATATNSSSHELIARVRAAIDGGATTALLVLRLPRFAQVAWRDGKRAGRRLERATARAFAHAAQRVMRDGDVLAHDAGSDWFALAMLAPARHGASARSFDARATLERISAAMSLVTREPLEAGWWPLERTQDLDDFELTIARALERGARERERFEFLAAVGHELRTPLTSIRGYVETLLDEPVDPDTTRRFLGVVRNEALRLARLVDGMLEFSLLDASGGNGRCDVGLIVRSAVETLAPVAGRAGVTLRSRAESGSVACIDGDTCMHAVLNVVENAIKYGGNGSNVVVTCKRQDAFVCIVVDDDGPGVEPGDRERIFAKGVRGARNAQRRGFGIGLSIVRTIAERAGGSVRVADSPLGGARFVVSLPSLRAEFPARLS